VATASLSAALSLAVLLVLFVLLAAPVAAGAPCANRILSELPSPDGRWNAVVFVRACGEPARFSTQLALVKAGKPLPNLAANVLVSAPRDAEAQESAGGERAIDARWESSEELVVRRPRVLELLQAKTRVKRVRIRYEEAD